MAAIISLLSLVCPALAFVFIVLYFRKTKNSALSALLFGLMMAAVFYGYRADSGADIYRHMQWLNFYKNIPLIQCFDAGHYKNMYIWDFWCWIISRFDSPYLLQASGALVTYSLSSYIVFDTIKRNAAKSETLVFALLFLIGLLKTRDVVLGIRSAAAYALLSFAVYRATVQKKNLLGCLLIAMMASFIHLSAGQFLLIFLFVLIFRKDYRKVAFVLFILAVGIGALSQWILGYIPTDGNIVFRIVIDALTQANDTTNMMHTLSLNAWINKWGEVAVCILAGIRVIVYEGRNGEKGAYLKEKEIWKFSWTCFAVNLGYCIALKQNGDRMLTINEISMIPYLVSIWCNDGIMKKKKYLLMDFLLVGGVAGLFLLHVYSLVWGNASAQSLLMGIFFGVVSGFFR